MSTRKATLAEIEEDAPAVAVRRRPALEGLAYETTPEVLIHNITRMQRSRFGRLAREVGLTGSQGQVLNRLSTDRGISLSTLAEMLEVELITASRLVDSLEAMGWAERRPSPTDRRVKLIFLLEAAADIQAKMHAIADQLHAELFARVAPNDYAELGRILAVMHETISGRS